MHVGMSQGQTFPFADNEDEFAIAAAPPGGRKNSMLQSVGKQKDKDTTIDDDETDSFVSATDSPSHQQRLLAEQKLRKKKQMQAQKKFEELKNERNKDKLNKGFGDLADMRASDPVTL